MDQLVIVMLAFLIVGSFGFFIGKKKLLSDQAANEISSLLVTYIMAATMIKSFIRPFDSELLLQLLLIFIITIFAILISIGLSRIFFKKDEVIERYSVIFNNKGFVGIPIVSALFGQEAVFYVTPAIIVSNIFVWTYGSRLLNSKVKFSIKNLFINPSMISLYIGLGIFLLPFKLPDTIIQSIDYLSALNTPLAMILLGYFLSSEPILTTFRNPKAWKSAFVRLVASPMVILGLMYLLPIKNIELKHVMVLIWGCPTAMNLSLFVSFSGKDPTYAAQITILSSLLSMITIPVIYKLAQLVIHHI